MKRRFRQELENEDAKGVQQMAMRLTADSWSLITQQFPACQKKLCEIRVSWLKAYSLKLTWRVKIDGWRAAILL